MGYEGTQGGVDRARLGLLQAATRRHHTDLMGDSAFVVLAHAVGDLTNMGSDQFAWRPRDLEDPRKAHRRRTFRRLVCLPVLRDEQDVDELADWLRVLCPNPAFGSTQTTAEVLYGWAGETPYWALQQVSRLLAGGVGSQEAARQAGVSHQCAEEVDQFLGVTEWRAMRDMDLAVRAVEEGWTKAETRKVSGWGNGKWSRMMEAARQALDDSQDHLLDEGPADLATA